MVGHDYKQSGMGKDGTGRYGKYHKRKMKTTLDETLGEDGGRKTAVGLEAMDWSPDGKRRRGRLRQD